MMLKLHFLAQLPGTACLHPQRPQKAACGRLGGSSSGVRCQPHHTHHRWSRAHLSPSVTVQIMVGLPQGSELIMHIQ